MSMYFLLKTVYGIYINDTSTLALINSAEILVVPVVNIDGYKLISEDFNHTGRLRLIRKNRNDGKIQKY